MLIFLFVIHFNLVAQDLWQKDTIIIKPRDNIYSLPSDELKAKELLGLKHVSFYPVKTTKLLIPYGPLERFFNLETNSPLKTKIFQWLQVKTGFKNFLDFEKWLGLNPFNEKSVNSPYLTPNPYTQKKFRMGTTVVQNQGTLGFTFSCAACHTSELFGRTVVGLTNRFPRANDFFVLGKVLAPIIHPEIFGSLLNASPEEIQMIDETLKTVKYIGAKKPQALGLDTSLASVALSLARRNSDDYATYSSYYSKHPRFNALSLIPADSKPMPWWNVKYKNRWLSDGSIISGNPILTNFLWNEIGRGADLHELEDWMKNNQKTVDELTVAVFSNQAPRYTDFFPATNLNLELAKKGEVLFVKNCQGCHGAYEKAWHDEDSKDVFATVLVKYPQKTKVIDVGTDPYRHQGMKYFAKELNQLQISKKMGTVVEVQKGYVPPPLVGIWARWPYFHNNSAPSLCAVLTPSSLRPKMYFARKPIDPKNDFDDECNGYPMMNSGDPEFLYDTRKLGLSNKGHDEKIFVKEGREIFSPQDKKALIMFLKTL